MIDLNFLTQIYALIKENKYFFNFCGTKLFLRGMRFWQNSLFKWNLVIFHIRRIIFVFFCDWQEFINIFKLLYEIFQFSSFWGNILSRESTVFIFCLIFLMGYIATRIHDPWFQIFFRKKLHKYILLWKLFQNQV